MDINDLTNEAKPIAKKLYKEYCRKMNSGDSRPQARAFGDLSSLKKYFPDENDDDLLDIVKELENNGWLQNVWGSDALVNSVLTTDAIAYCQKSF
ncbi:hypothetical protein LBAT_0504 [Lactobacillus acetotolerans]|uniref:Uncharacterized protein n=1 Tax=Lactobacillus acetotolerans TaxID=1600 RepID=A0A0D6A242_9LACO|nr:hypothetical protein [Lactobacillus acetotolerans]BAQ56893.1 hypothetical protein LBAT_0504 [Lactobacillus acetotolerans]